MPYLAHIGLEADVPFEPVGYKQEIQTKDAVILSDASGELQSYRIVIDDLDYTPGDKNKGIRFHVEDENLLKLTGGIVQGKQILPATKYR